MERVLVDAGVHMSSSAALLVLVQGEGDGAGQSFAVTGTRVLSSSYHFVHITFTYVVGFCQRNAQCASHLNCEHIWFIIGKIFLCQKIFATYTVFKIQEILLTS